MSINLSIPQLETKVAKLQKGIKNSGKIAKGAKIVAIAAALTTAAVGIKSAVSDKEVLPETAVPAAIALAGYGTAVGANKRRKSKTIDFRLANEELEGAKWDKYLKQKKEEEKLKVIAQQEAESQKLEQQRLEQEEQRKQQEIIKKESYFLHANLKGHSKFPLSKYLHGFGIEEIPREPLSKKENYHHNEFTEFYQAKDGKSAYATIQYFSAEPDKKDLFTYQSVHGKSGDVCECGRVHYIKEGENGGYQVIEYDVQQQYLDEWHEDGYTHPGHYKTFLFNKKVRQATHDEAWRYINMDKNEQEQAHKFVDRISGYVNDKRPILLDSFLNPQELN